MNDFLQPPTKELSEMLNDSHIEFSSPELKTIAGNTQIDGNGQFVTGVLAEDRQAFNMVMAKLLADIADAEETCLKTIHARYCIPRALNISIADISRLEPFESRPNYWEYWYNFHDTKKRFFLMSREVTLNEKGMPVLDVKFNKVLAREGE